MQQIKHTATESSKEQPPSPLINIGVQVTPETRRALHHMAGAQNITLPRLLRQIVEDAVALEAR